MNKFSTYIFTGLMVVTIAAATDRNNKGLEVSFSTSDQGTVHALLDGDGLQGVVLAHGAIFNKESWGDFTKVLTTQGLRTLALDFRGYGKSTAGLSPDAMYEDVLAAVRYLHQIGVRKVSVIGASMGGGAAARAAIQSTQDEIAKVILLSAVPVQHPEQLKGELLFIASKDESLAPAIRDQYEQAPQPKKLVLLNGNAHAQHIFKTDQAEKLKQVLIDFLLDKNPQ